jgi:hypothetical protein
MVDHLPFIGEEDSVDPLQSRVFAFITPREKAFQLGEPPEERPSSESGRNGPSATGLRGHCSCLAHDKSC